jgi:hypothetical protein
MSFGLTIRCHFNLRKIILRSVKLTLLPALLLPTLLLLLVLLLLLALLLPACTPRALCVVQILECVYKVYSLQ